MWYSTLFSLAIFKTLSSEQLVDLTHTLSIEMSVYPGKTPFTR